MSRRDELDHRGIQLIKDALPDELPELFERMPYNWVERLWKYCLTVWVNHQSDPVRLDMDEDKRKEMTILWEDHREPLFHKFKLFLQYMRETSHPEEISMDFQNIMNEGFNVVTKSWFKVSAGETSVRQITFLEHYLLMLREKPEMEPDLELMELLTQFTRDSQTIISSHRQDSHKFLGILIN